MSFLKDGILKDLDMKSISVDSSSIARIGYDEKTETLEVTFITGLKYRYYRVPEAVAEEFMYHPPDGSYGRYLNFNIKGTYGYTKIK